MAVAGGLFGRSAWDEIFIGTRTPPPPHTHTHTHTHTPPLLPTLFIVPNRLYVVSVDVKPKQANMPTSFRHNVFPRNTTAPVSFFFGGSSSSSSSFIVVCLCVVVVRVVVVVVFLFFSSFDRAVLLCLGKH